MKFSWGGCAGIGNNWDTHVFVLFIEATPEIGKMLNISQSAVSRSSLRGEKIEQENRFELIETH